MVGYTVVSLPVFIRYILAYLNSMFELEYTDVDGSIRYILAYLDCPDVHTQLRVGKLIY